jgi:hypothetical protein
MTEMPPAKRTRRDETVRGETASTSTAAPTAAASTSAPDLPTTDQVLYRVAGMSESAAKLLLVDIILNNEEARRRFHESALSSPTHPPVTGYPIAPLAGYNYVPQQVGAQQPSFRRVAGLRPEQFDYLVDEVREAVLGDRKHDDPWSMESARELEDQVESAYETIGKACTTSSSQSGAAPSAISFHTKHSGLEALFGIAQIILAGKKKPTTVFLMDMEAGGVARVMKAIARSLSQQEKDEILQTPFDLMLNELAEKMEPWDKDYTEVATILCSRS